MNPDGTITVDMGEPILDGPTVPTTLSPNSEHNSVLEQTHICNGKEWKISMVSMGNPHAVIFVNDLEKDIDFESDGPALESDRGAFPAKTNVEFVQVMSPTHLKMKVWERGAGPTLACGTGTCALVVAAIRAGKVERPPVGESVRVTLPGGDLFIEWREDNNKVYMVSCVLIHGDRAEYLLFCLQMFIRWVLIPTILKLYDLLFFPLSRLVRPRLVSRGLHR
jgi:diaminopimelate epimerase